MLLSSLLDRPHAAALEVSGLTADSRAVKPGFVFFAMPGTKADGLTFAPQAIAAGAVAVVAEREIDLPVPVIRVDNVRLALSQAAARFYPRQPAVIAAVTGTSGKSSIVAFLRQIFLAAGHQAASIGTVGIVKPSGESYGTLTTPDPVSLHRMLDEIAGEGVTHCAFEASSHGLDQYRLDGVRITAAAFTNLSRDHLDYHPDFAAYRTAKLRLFTELLPADGTAVVVDGEEGAHFIAAAQKRGQKLITIGRQDQTIAIREEVITAGGQRLRLRFGGEDYTLHLPLIGSFQVDNALTAAGLAMACGVAPQQAFASLEKLQGAPGRLELVGTAGGAPVIVDYSHKPDALDKVLEALRPFAKGRLCVVFGCGGDRDPGKRPIMGALRRPRPIL